MIAKELICDNLDILDEGEKLKKLGKTATALALAGTTLFNAYNVGKTAADSKPGEHKQMVRTIELQRERVEAQKRIAVIKKQIEELSKGIPDRYEHNDHKNYWEIIRKYQGDIPDLFLDALIERESGWNKNATNPAGDYGLMQVNIRGAIQEYNRVHNTRFTGIQAKNDVDLNIRIGIWYLHQIAKDHDIYNNPEMLYTKYHRGYSRTQPNSNVVAFMKIYNRLKKEKQNEINNQLALLRVELSKLEK